MNRYRHSSIVDVDTVAKAAECPELAVHSILVDSVDTGDGSRHFSKSEYRHRGWAENIRKEIGAW